MTGAISFDERINRREVPALKTHKMALGKDGENQFAAGVVDIAFKASLVVRTAIQMRLDHGEFGYVTVLDGQMPVLTDGSKTGMAGPLKRPIFCAHRTC